MRLVFAQEARLEFEEAERHYERQSPGLGLAFKDEIRAALRRIRLWPAAERGDVRRLTSSRFPYKLLYSGETDHLYVIAVAHRHRKPEYWARRPKAR